ncbi:hypothetical protein D3C85_1713950 [compost metagenome]
MEYVPHDSDEPVGACNAAIRLDRDGSRWAPKPEATTVRYNPKFVFATASQPNGPYRWLQPDATALLYIHTDKD